MTNLLRNPFRNPLKRFFTKINETNTCWLWTGYVSQTGYGMFTPEPKKNILAHRFMWELINGKIPKGLYVLHKCDVRNCVNPDHLFLGTQADNIKDMVLKGRAATGDRNGSRKYQMLTGENHPRAKLTNSQVIEIREIASTGLSHYKIAKLFNVSQMTIWLIVNKKIWKHI